MSAPTVSVVIPAFNAGPTIDEALASVAAQSRRADEVVVVDDASSDDTAARARAWSGRLPVRVITNDTNGGCGSSRATAVAAASGQIIAPLDADDIWCADHLETLVPLAVDRTVIVATGYRQWQPERGVDASPPATLAVPPADQQPSAILRYNFLFSGALAWREAIMSIGGGSQARKADDWEVWIRLIVEAQARAVPAPRTTVLYRTHLGSLSVLDGCLPEEIELCERLLATPSYAPYADAIRATLRRRRARQQFLHGAQAADWGNRRAARAAFVHAMRIDPSLSGGAQPGALGSVALRCCLGVVTPRLAARARARRLTRKALLQASAGTATAAGA